MLGASMMGVGLSLKNMDWTDWHDELTRVEEDMLRVAGIPEHMLGSDPYGSTQALQEKYKAELLKAQDAQRRELEAYERAITQRFEKSPEPRLPKLMAPTVKKTRAQKKAEKEEREKARRRALVNTDLRVIDRREYRKNEHPADREVREGLEYLGLNK